jgi:hypothetical protein
MKAEKKQKWMVYLKIGQEDYSDRSLDQNFYPQGAKSDLTLGRSILLAVMPKDQPLFDEHKIQVEVNASLALDDVRQECLKQMKTDYTRLGGEFVMLYFKDPAKQGTGIVDKCYGVRDRQGKVRAYKNPLHIEPLPDIGSDPIKPAGTE